MGLYTRGGSTLSYTLVEQAGNDSVAGIVHRVDMTIQEGFLKNPVGSFPAPGVANYVRGSNAVQGVGAVIGVLQNIDMHIYGTISGPRMSFVVRPGGDPDQLRLVFNGQDSLKADVNGMLKMYLGQREIRLSEAVAYQVDQGNNLYPVSWTASYIHAENTGVVQFSFGTYAQTKPLVFQIGYPALMGGGGTVDHRNMEWCTYAGGASGDELTSVEVDEDGNAYTCGKTWSADFPVAPGTEFFPPFQPQQAGWASAVAMKFDALTKQLMWATYFGGQGQTIAHKCAVYKGTDTSLDYVFLTGSTNSSDFPTFHEPGSPFVNAVHDIYSGGGRRMWVGGFRRSNGSCDWSTTHGAQNGDTWSEDGLAIDVDNGGNVAVGGRLTGSVENETPDFQLVTPANSFARPVGGGFVITFSSNYTINWATTFASLWYQTQVTDMRFERTLNDYNLWIVGADAGDLTVPLDVVPHPDGGFYQPDAMGTSAFLARFRLSDHQLTFCTRWGGQTFASSTEAYGIEISSKFLYVVGYTGASDLTALHCPDPGGPDVLSTYIHQTNAPWQYSDGFILRFSMYPFSLNYGTLIGGAKDDILLDVDASENVVYITGETRSASGFSADLNPNWYHQPQYALNNNRRDAILLALSEDNTNPHLTWRSIMGGTESDRGWGIAASADEVYVVGSTASYEWDGFPLREYNVVDPLDFYQEYNMGGSENYFVPWYEFNYALDHEHEFFEWMVEQNDGSFDGFIASFRKSYSPVGLEGNIAAPDPYALIVRPIGNGYQWVVTLPTEGSWTIEVVDVSGRVVSTIQTIGSNGTVDLEQAAGLYVIRATTETGEQRSAKIVKR